MNGANIIENNFKLEIARFLAFCPRIPLIVACTEIGICPIQRYQKRVGIDIANGLTRVCRWWANKVFATQVGPRMKNPFSDVANHHPQVVSGGTK